MVYFSQKEYADIMEKKRVLIIDDEKDFCFFLKENLSLIGDYKVMIAKGGNMGSALARCRWRKPDIIIMDIMMPGINGIELLRKLKKDRRTSKIAVIMVSAREDLELELKKEGLNYDAFIAKPIGIEKLLTEMEKALQKHQLQA